MENSSVKSESKAIYKFATSIEEYMANLEKSTRMLLNAHENMKSFWKDAQYNQMTQNLFEFDSEIKKLKKELDILCDEAKVKAKQLEETEGVQTRVAI